MALKVDLEGSSTGFTQMLGTVRTQVKAFSHSISEEVGESWGSLGKQFAASIAGIFTVEGIKSGLEWFVETGKEIKEQSDQLNMSADAWQKWKDAVEEAGLTATGFQRIVEALRDKRTAALLDPKARGELNRLGFSDADITGNMDMSEFTRRALENANGGDQQRAYLSDIIGQRGLKYAGALDNLAGAEPEFSEADLKKAEETAKKLHKIGRWFARLTVGAVDFFTDEGAQRSMLDRFFTWTGAKRRLTDQQRANLEAGYPENYHTPVQMRNGLPFATGPADASGERAGPVDPFDAQLAAQQEQNRLREEDRQRQLRESQRSLMTIGDRRDSLMRDVQDLQKEIAGRKAQMNGEDFLTDAQRQELSGVTGKAREFQVNKLRQEFEDRTTQLQIQLNRDRADLRQRPLDFQADTLSKAGLYSANALNFSPLLDINREQLKELRTIAANTRPPGRPGDQPPFRP